MNYYVSLAILTITTVIKLLFAILCGMIVIPFFSSPETSVRGFSYLSVNIFLPCLLGTNLCLNASIETLSKFYWAPVLAFLPVAIGFTATFFLKRFISKKYYGIMVLGCIFQNGLTFPLGLVSTIKGLSWLTPEEVKNAQTYVFLYNLVCSMGLWSVGNPWIAYCSRQEQKEKNNNNENSLTESTQRSCPVDGAEISSLWDSNCINNCNSGSCTRRSAEFYLEYYQPCVEHHAPIHVATRRNDTTYLSGQNKQDNQSRAGGTALSSSMQRFITKAVFMLRSFIKITSSPPLLSSIISLIIGLTPPLRWLIETSIGAVIINALQVISVAAIPMQLIVLGCTMSRSNKKDNSKDSNSKNKNELPAEQGHEKEEELERRTNTANRANNNSNEEHHHTGRETSNKWWQLNVMHHWNNEDREKMLLCVCTIILRLLIVPAISFGVLHILVVENIVPTSKPFLLVMLLEFCAPSAVNATLICIINNYHYKEFAHIIFFMYMSAMGTIAFWLFFYVLYLGQ